MQMAALLTLLRKCHSDNLLWRTLSLGRVADTYNSVFGRLTAGFNANPGSMMTPFQTSLLFKCLEAGYHTGGELSTCMRTPRKMCNCFLNSEALVAPSFHLRTSSILWTFVTLAGFHTPPQNREEPHVMFPGRDYHQIAAATLPVSTRQHPLCCACSNT